MGSSSLKALSTRSLPFAGAAARPHQLLARVDAALYSAKTGAAIAPRARGRRAAISIPSPEP